MATLGRRFVLALMLVAVLAAAFFPQAALAASGGVMGGRSSSSSSSSKNRRSSSWGSEGNSYYSSRTTYVSVGTPAPPSVATAAGEGPGAVFWMVAIGLVVLVAVAAYRCRPRTTVVKLQVALLGWAKPFQQELNEIADRVRASNKPAYKLMLTETICSLSRHKDCCVFSSLSVDVKDGTDSWEEHFDEISIEERSKFDEETLYSLEGIKRTKEYSKKQDGSRNEYIVVTIVVAANGALEFPKITRPADLEAVVKKLNSLRAGDIWGIHVLWTPQEENDVLTEEKLLADYPHLRPHYDD
ncbi:uncharacterized protein LOC124689661 [Lolium rigidum]|uniref:uncharacterized protein LOC124689661 n=1 Tax=Lolium rigidum TaxID=89674 RepID=UPI001F5E2E5C|nr:uncharacterized protein LOC124689661 [Lolium rigidum]